MWLHYDKKYKTRYILFKGLILMGIILALVGAYFKTGLKLPSLEHKLSFGFGFILLVVVGAMAFFNRIKLLFKVRSIGFLILFIMLLLLSVAMETLLWSLGLVSIPLIIDDLIVETYFKYVNITYYWDKWKYISNNVN